MSRGRPHGIIPDDLLDRISRHAPDIAARLAARRSLAITQQLRQRRQEAVEPDAGEAREVYDAKGADQRGEKVRAEDEAPIGDPAVDALYDDAGRWYERLRGDFGRDSYDGAGATLVTVAHYEARFDNAFWDGAAVWVGDGFYFRPFHLARTVTFHEWTHALTEHTLGLAYLRQSGALNESISDCWAAALEQSYLGQRPADADWLIGRELFGPGLRGRALRDMRNPGTAYDDPVLGTDPQPAHMRDYYAGPSDNYGVHINSGIPNRAFALAASLVDGPTIATVLPVIWRVMRGREVPPAATFQQFADAMGRVAAAEFSPAVRDAVVAGWDAVGIVVRLAPVPGEPVPVPAPETPCELSDAEILSLVRNPAVVDALLALLASSGFRRVIAAARGRARKEAQA